MSTNDIDIHHLGAAYALDALDERERAAFEAHYPSCEVCRGDVLAFRAATAQLARMSAATPPQALKASIMAEIAETRQLSPLLPSVVTDLAEHRRRNRRRIVNGLGMAAAIVLVMAGVLTIGGGSEPSYAAQIEAVLEAPDVAVSSLAPDGAAPGTVVVAWSADEGRAVVMADNLQPAPAGMAYELWLIGSDGPVPMRLLDTAPGGSVHRVVSLEGRPTAWGVTLEPSGGSPAPTGDIIYQTTV